MNKKISVIIPAYNASKTIEKCINSIQNQTYKNLEIIVVNDGSKDNTKEVLENIAKADERVKVLSIENSGVSHARNVGIDNATGDFYTFVDSDDSIHTDMYSHLIGLIDKYDVKIAHCSYTNVYEDGTEVPVGNKGNIEIQNHDDAVDCILSGRLFSGGIWNKLFSAEIFENVRLNEKIKFNEDVLMSFMLFDKVEKSVYSDMAYYNYFQNLSSATHLASGIISCEQGLSVSEEMLELSVGKSYELSAKKRLAYSKLCLYRAYLFANNKADKLKVKNTKKDIIRYNKEGLYPNKRDRITVGMYRYIPHLYKYLYTMYDKVRVKKLDPEQ